MFKFNYERYYGDRDVQANARSEHVDTIKFDRYANGRFLGDGPGSARYSDWQMRHMSPLMQDIMERTGGLLACGIIKL